jgi:uncharacterized protein (DUF2141 family)
MTKTLTCFAVIALSSTFAAVADAQSPSAAGEVSPAADMSGVAAAKGKVVGSSNEPQAGVPVQIKGPLGQTVAITDKSGTWSIYNLPAGNYKAQMIGAEKSKTDPVDFTVKSASFWEKLSGTSQKDVVWTPELKIGNTISTITPVQ